MSGPWAHERVRPPTAVEETVKTIHKHGSFGDVLSGSSEDLKEIATLLRHLIIEIYPDVVEVPWPRQGIAGYGVGPKKMSEHFCYIGMYQDHVNLGFYHGADLPDPARLLEGTGKKLRHVKIRDIGQVERPSIRELIEASLVERKKALGTA
jgi:hypothetical protein